MEPLNLLELATSDGNFGVFIDMIEAAQMEHVLTNGDPLTVLAPTNAALAGLVDREVSYLTSFIRDHLLAGAHTTTAIIGAGSVRSLAGEIFNVDAFGTLLAVGGAVIVRPDLRASNGLLHGIDHVLMSAGLPRARGPAQV